MLKMKYGISSIVYEEILSTQGGVCAICKNPETQTEAKLSVPRRLSVDHDHLTNKVRGILCSNCNNGLGRFKDDISALKEAIIYLEKFL